MESGLLSKIDLSPATLGSQLPYSLSQSVADVPLHHPIVGFNSAGYPLYSVVKRCPEEKRGLILKLFSYRFLAIVLSLVTMTLAKAAVGQTSNKERIPSAVEECEGPEQLRLCSTWKWTGKGFDGSWPDGSVGHMTIVFVEQGREVLVTFNRVDQTGTTAGLAGVYMCQERNDKVQNGHFTRTFNGVTKTEPWIGR